MLSLSRFSIFCIEISPGLCSPFYTPFLICGLSERSLVDKNWRLCLGSQSSPSEVVDQHPLHQWFLWRWFRGPKDMHHGCYMSINVSLPFSSKIGGIILSLIYCTERCFLFVNIWFSISVINSVTTLTHLPNDGWAVSGVVVIEQLLSAG